MSSIHGVTCITSKNSYTRRNAYGLTITTVRLHNFKTKDMLNVSRPHVVKLVEKGDLPFHKVGSHRRIKLKDLEKYRIKMEKKRGQALTELTRISQEMDLDY